MSVMKNIDEKLSEFCEHDLPRRFGCLICARDKPLSNFISYSELDRLTARLVNLENFYVDKFADYERRIIKSEQNFALLKFQHNELALAFANFVKEGPYLNHGDLSYLLRERDLLGDRIDKLETRPDFPEVETKNDFERISEDSTMPKVCYSCCGNGRRCESLEFVACNWRPILIQCYNCDGHGYLKYDEPVVHI